jgi:hypothetical protein
MRVLGRYQSRSGTGSGARGRNGEAEEGGGGLGACPGKPQELSRASGEASPACMI